MSFFAYSEIIMMHQCKKETFTSTSKDPHLELLIFLSATLMCMQGELMIKGLDGSAKLGGD